MNFDDGGVEVTLLDDCLVIDLNGVVNDVDIEEIYPKDEFKH